MSYPLSTEDLLEHYMTILVNNAEYKIEFQENGYSSKQETPYNERELNNFSRLLTAQALDGINLQLVKILRFLETHCE